jgi:hypothetical protein
LERLDRGHVAARIRRGGFAAQRVYSRRLPHRIQRANGSGPSR